MGQMERDALFHSANRLGELTNEEYLAVKTKVKRILQFKNCTALTLLNNMPVQLNQLRPGDGLKITATFNDIINPNKINTGTLVMNQLQSVNIGKNNSITIEGDVFILTTMNISEYIYLLDEILNTPMMGFPIEELLSLIPPNASLTDWEFAKDKYIENKKEQEKQKEMQKQKENEINQAFDFSFDDF